MGGMGRHGRAYRRARASRPRQSICRPSLPAAGREDRRRLPLGLVTDLCHQGTAVRRSRARAWHDRIVRKDEGAATTSAELRAHNLARLLRAVHDGAGQLTRAELTRQLSLARATATVLVRDLA